MLIKNQIYEAVITDYTSEGQGVAHIEGCAVFIPNAICGEKVRGDLDSGKLSVKSFGKSFDRKGLCQPGKTFQQNVSIGNQCRKQTVDEFLLTGNDPAHFSFQRTEKRRCRGDLPLQFL